MNTSETRRRWRTISFWTLPNYAFGSSLIMTLICTANLRGFEPNAFGEEKLEQTSASHREDVRRVFPKEPDEAVKTFQVPNGFRMELIAREPLLTSPVAITYDENGNMYVAEMVDFPFPEKAADKPNGR